MVVAEPGSSSDAFTVLMAKADGGTANRSSKGPPSTWNSAEATLLPPASVTVAVMVTSVLMITGSGVARELEVTGGAVSILTTTEAELDRPAPLVAEQVKVVPVVGALIIVGSQPGLLLETIPDSGSETLHVTVTGKVLFHPAPFGRGLTVGTMTGGVVSAPGGFTVSVIGWLIVRVVPPASARKIDAMGHDPVSAFVWE